MCVEYDIFSFLLFVRAYFACTVDQFCRTLQYMLKLFLVLRTWIGDRSWRCWSKNERSQQMYFSSVGIFWVPGSHSDQLLIPSIPQQLSLSFRTRVDCKSAVFSFVQLCCLAALHRRMHHVRAHCFQGCGPPSLGQAGFQEQLCFAQLFLQKIRRPRIQGNWKLRDFVLLWKLISF